MLHYTTVSLRDLGVFTTVQAKSDTQKAREQAIEQFHRMAEDPANSVPADAFPDGLSRDDLVVFDPTDIAEKPASSGESDLIEGVKRIAAFAVLKAKKDKAGIDAVPYHALIPRLLAAQPLSETEANQIMDKSFEKALSRFAATAAEYSGQLEDARAAIKLLGPYLEPYVQAGQTPAIVKEIEEAHN